MLNMTCPACQAQCQFDDKFRGRKIKCPKCGTRVRHLPDGNFELLSMGQVPPPPPPGATPAPEGGAPPASTNVPVISALASQSESIQNAVVVLAVVHLFAFGLLALGFALGKMPVFASVFALTLLITWIVFLSKRRRTLRIERASEETAAVPMAQPPAPAPGAPALPAPVVPPIPAAPPAPAQPVSTWPPAPAAPAARPAPVAPSVPAIPPAPPAPPAPPPPIAPIVPAIPAAPPAPIAPPIDPGANVSSTEKTEPIPKADP